MVILIARPVNGITGPATPVERLVIYAISTALSEKSFQLWEGRQAGSELPRSHRWLPWRSPGPGSCNCSSLFTHRQIIYPARLTLG